MTSAADTTREKSKSKSFFDLLKNEYHSADKDASRDSPRTVNGWLLVSASFVIMVFFLLSFIAICVGILGGIFHIIFTLKFWSIPLFILTPFALFAVSVFTTTVHKYFNQ